MKKLLSLLLCLPFLLGQNTTTLAGINYVPEPESADYFASLFYGGLPSTCTGAAVTLDQGGAVTFARASTAFCKNSSNVLVSVASGEPRVEADGLKIEGSRTNLTLQSQTMDVDASGWTHESVSVSANTGDTNAPDGTATAEKVTITAANAQHRLFPDAAQTVTGGYTISVYVKLGTLTHVGVFPSSAINARISVKLSDCTVSSTAGGALINSGVESLTNGWCRIWNAYTGDGTGSRLIMKFGNSDANTVSGSTWLGASETVYVWGGQHEAGDWVSSYIPTTTTSVNRPLETASFTPAQSIAAAGCVYTEFHGPIALNNGGRIWGLPAASGSGYVQMGATNVRLAVADGTGTVSTDAASTILNRAVTTRAWWNVVSEMSIDVDAVTGTPGSFDGAVSTGAIQLGSQDSANHGYVHIKKLKIGTSATGCLD